MQNDQMPYKPKCAVVREEYVAITGDCTAALLLNQMIYWSERVNDFDAFLAEERERRQKAGNEPDDLPFRHGWIYKRADDLKDEIMSDKSARTIERRLADLVERGFLSRKRGKDDDPRDRTYYYRVNFTAVMEALDRAGYVLRGYAKYYPSQNTASENPPESPPAPTEPANNTADGQANSVSGQIVACKRQGDACKRQDVGCKRQGVASTLEITTEINLETLSPPISPPDVQNTPVTMEDDPGELDSFFAGMGLEQLRHQEAVQWLKALMADLWHTRRIGKEQIPASTIREALRILTPQILDPLLDRVYRQRQKGDISLPELYVQRAILKAAQSAGFDKMARQGGGGEAHAPTYDMQDYINFSMQRLLGENNTSHNEK